MVPILNRETSALRGCGVRFCERQHAGCRQRCCGSQTRAPYAVRLPDRGRSPAFPTMFPCFSWRPVFGFLTSRGKSNTGAGNTFVSDLQKTHFFESSCFANYRYNIKKKIVFSRTRGATTQPKSNLDLAIDWATRIGTKIIEQGQESRTPSQRDGLAVRAFAAAFMMSLRFVIAPGASSKKLPSSE